MWSGYDKRQGLQLENVIHPFSPIFQVSYPSDYSRSGAMEDHDSQPPQRRRHLMMMMIHQITHKMAATIYSGADEGNISIIRYIWVIKPLFHIIRCSCPQILYEVQLLYTHAFTYARAHIRTHTRTHARTHTRTHTVHTHTIVQACDLSLLIQ